MKRLLINTALGRFLSEARNRMELIRSSLGSQERLGTLVNDQLSTKLVTRLCLGGKGFIDVGAHIGSVLAEVTRLDKTIQCSAVEAIPDKAAHLRRKFPKVQVHECAAGDSEGEVSFFVNTRRSGYSSLGRPGDLDAKEFTEIRVPMRRLDTLEMSADIDTMKVDVEGAELGVFMGSATILANKRPTIMFESAPPTNPAELDKKKRIWQLFFGHKYSILIPNRVPHDGPGLSEEGFCESHLYPRRTTNYFAVANERRTEIRDRARNVLGIR